MTLSFAIFTYICTWCVTLFAVLPFGVKMTASEDRVAGQAGGAPDKPRLAIKFLVNSLIALIITAAIYWLVSSGYFTMGEE